MGPPIYDCPGLTLNELPWGEWHSAPAWALGRGGDRRTAALLVGGYTIVFTQWASGAVHINQYPDIELLRSEPGDVLLAAAFAIELTKGKTLQDPNGTGWERNPRR